MSKIAGCFRERVFTGWRVIKGIRRKSMEYEKMVLLIRAVDDLLKFVEFIDWLQDNYPELLPLHSKSL